MVSMPLRQERKYGFHHTVCEQHGNGNDHRMNETAQRNEGNSTTIERQRYVCYVRMETRH